MTRKFKSISAIALSALMIATMTACGEGSGVGNSGSKDDGTTTTTTAPITTNATDKNVQEKVDQASENVDKSIEVTKKIKWMAWWRMDETAATAEMFKKVYGIPEEGDSSYGDDADHIFQNIFITTYSERYDQLAKAISAGDSPDMFPFEISNYPYSVCKNMFQSIDGVVDITKDEWSATSDVMAQFKWAGKNYCAIPSVNLSSVLFYRKSIIEEAGLDDPYELYQEGKWDWDAFLEMGDKFQNSGENKFLCDGWYVPAQLLGTTGVPLVGITDGKLQANFNDANVVRAMEFITKLQTENYRYPRHELNAWGVNPIAWAKGDTLFYNDGTWGFEAGGDVGTAVRKKFKIDAEDVFFVPFPKDPQSDEYYQIMKQDAIMLVAGAQNKDGFAAWQNCVIACETDPEVTKASIDKAIKDYGWTQEQRDYIEELRTGGVTPIFDFKNGLGSEVSSADSSDTPVECLTAYPYLTGQATYTQLVSENESTIQAAIDQLNATATE